MDFQETNGIQTGVFYIFLALSPNLLAVNRQVANLEAMNNRGELEGNIINEINSYIHGFDGIEKSLSIYRVSITLLPMLVLSLAVFLAFFVYVTDEKKYMEYVEEVKKQKNNQ